MKIKFTRPTIYVSHPIRGSNGDIEGNCKKAAAAARRLRRVFPEVDFYVPAEHDLTLQVLTADDRLTIDDIMYADLKILDASHGWMSYHFDNSKGSDIEQKEAERIDLPRFTVTYDIERASYDKLRKDFAPLVAATVERYRAWAE